MTEAGAGTGTVAEGRITPWQLALLLVTAGAAQESTVINRLLTPLAGRDLWISILLALPGALLGVAAILALAGRYPRQDLAAILRQVLGVAAYPLILAYAALFLASAAQAGAEFTDISHLVFLSTPPSAFLLPLIGAAVYGSILGLEVVARVNSALLLFIDIPLGILLSLLTLGSQRLDNVLPVLANGWAPVLSGAQLVLGTWGQFVLLLVLLPLTERPGSAGRASLWAVVLMAVMALGHNLGPVLVFGDAVTRLVWPSFTEVRAITAGRFIERLDVVAIWLWIHGYWLQVTVMLHAAALTITNTFGLKNHRPVVLALGVAALGLALLVPNQAWSMRLRWDLNAIAFLALGFGLPLLLLAWSHVRGRVGRARRRGNAAAAR